MSESHSRQIRREIVRDGRTYTASVQATPNGKVQISVVSSDDSGAIVSEMSGTVDPDDFGMFGKIFRPEFAAMAVREETNERSSKLEERRQADPNFGGNWTAADRRRVLAMHQSGAPVEEIAAAFGRSVNGIRIQLRRMGAQVAWE